MFPGFDVDSTCAASASASRAERAGGSKVGGPAMHSSQRTDNHTPLESSVQYIMTQLTLISRSGEIGR